MVAVRLIVILHYCFLDYSPGLDNISTHEYVNRRRRRCHYVECTGPNISLAEHEINNCFCYLRYGISDSDEVTARDLVPSRMWSASSSSSSSPSLWWLFHAPCTEEMCTRKRFDCVDDSLDRLRQSTWSLSLCTKKLYPTSETNPIFLLSMVGWAHLSMCSLYNGQARQAQFTCVFSIHRGGLLSLISSKWLSTHVFTYGSA